MCLKGQGRLLSAFGTEGCGNETEQRQVMSGKFASGDEIPSVVFTLATEAGR